MDDDDIAAFETCFGQPVPPNYWEPCHRADIDGDNDVDCQDYGNLRTSYMLYPPKADPGLLLPECPWCTTPLANGGFEDGIWPPWSPSGDYDPVILEPLWACGFQTPFGSRFAGKVTSGGHINWTFRRIIDVDGVGDGQLDKVELRAFYLMTAAGNPAGPHPDRVTQTWTLYWKTDGTQPANPDDLLNTASYQLATYDGTLSMTGDNWCEGKWAYVETVVEPLDISPATNVQQVILECTSATSAVSSWTFSFIDEVDACVAATPVP
ncbi:MAG: hypothetical protein GTO22_16655, partial [Gemmatimonadales bacterium]|nr:hypothetical protein [Gemmatimonadales bacterium]